MREMLRIDGVSRDRAGLGAHPEGHGFVLVPAEGCG
jgi:hypothetical protein